MPRVRQIGGGGSLGDIYIVDSCNRVYHSTPFNHLVILESQPFGPQLVREQAACANIAKNIEKTLKDCVSADEILINIDWNNGHVLWVRLG